MTEKPYTADPQQLLTSPQGPVARISNETYASLMTAAALAVNAIKADALREFADANRFPNDWIMFRRNDDSGVTVGDLLRETANRLEGKSDV